jgi:hypothetical protein
MTILGRTPALWIGIIVSVVIAVVQTLQGNGVISDALAGHITDATNELGSLLTILAPFIAGVLIHPQVTPITAPALPAGTTVTVLTPGDAPNHTTVVA